ncbi:MAG: FCD domain-containing protein, partial [Chthoniobacterales bacterium]
PRLGPVVRRVDRNEFLEMLDLREIVETGAVRLAAVNATRKEIEAISELCQNFLILARQAWDRNLPEFDSELAVQMHKQDAAFHNLILVAAKNRRLYRMAEDLHLIARVFEHGCDEDIANKDFLTRMTRVYRGHARITRALRGRNPDLAEKFMRQHLMLAKNTHLALFDWRSRQEIVIE